MLLLLGPADAGAAVAVVGGVGLAGGRLLMVLGHWLRLTDGVC